MAEGQLLGSLPNVEWGACSLDEIRLLSNFQGLPPVSSLSTVGRASYRYVRQEDPLWSQLHQGILTTGYLPQSLGFFEPLSAKKLGLPRSRVSHRHLLAAYQRLLMPPYAPQAHAGKDIAAAVAVAGAAAGAAGAANVAAEAVTEAEAAAELHNAQATADFNAGKPCVADLHSALAAAAGAAPQANGSLEPGSAATKHGSSSNSSTQPAAASRQLGTQPRPQQERSNGSAPYFVLPLSPRSGQGGNGSSSSSKRKKRQSRRKPGSSEGQGEGGAAAEAGSTHRGAAQVYPGRPSEEQKLKLARSLGQQGLDAVCCTWGKTQEPASLHALASLLPPTSQLVEVGLCQLEPHLDLPPEWGFTAPAALPPLGASPDALLRHAVCAVPAGVPAGAPAAAAAAAGLLPPPELAAGSAGALVTLVRAAAAIGGPNAAAGPAQAAAPAAGAGAAAAAVGDAAAEAASSEDSEGEAGAQPGAAGAACRDGDGSVGGADLAGVEEELLGLQLEGEADNVGASREGPPGASDNPEGRLQAQKGASANGSSSSSNGSSGGSRGTGSGSSQDGPGAATAAVPRPTGVQYLEEVVEVKNVCPFGVNQRRGGRRKPASPYLVADREPRQEVKPEWVPQLQQHMLCSGTHSAVLLSRSATRGVRVFRMSRDDDYLALMLRVLGRFWREHVLPCRPPPQDMFASWGDYHALLARTVALARAAPLVLEVPSTELQQPAGADLRFFLD